MADGRRPEELGETVGGPLVLPVHVLEDCRAVDPFEDDEEGTIALRGADDDTVSCADALRNMGECEFMMQSMDVKFEGKNVARMGDPLFHNKKNIMM